MKLFKTRKGIVLQSEGKYYLIDEPWDELINREGLFAYLEKASGITTASVASNVITASASSNVSAASAAAASGLTAAEAALWIKNDLTAPIGSQEVWAAGVTYLRSRNARMEESKDSGGADFYDKVYEAERPELFFKSFPHRVAAHGEAVYIRKDSSWNVPEPELTLFINHTGSIQGYTIGNDMSSRSIEGENPLYLPQAKVYERSAALGPCLYVPKEPISKDTVIHMTITRDGKQVYTGEIAISQIKRSLKELASWLFRETDYPAGAYLMTGTCLVPPNEFTLTEKDIVEINIDGIGILTNYISYKPDKT